MNVYNEFVELFGDSKDHIFDQLHMRLKKHDQKYHYNIYKNTDMVLENIQKENDVSDDTMYKIFCSYIQNNVLKYSYRRHDNTLPFSVDNIVLVVGTRVRNVELVRSIYQYFGDYSGIELWVPKTLKDVDQDDEDE